MMASGYVITVTEADFEYEVIAFSQQLPVVVDFWAEWCVPCKTLGPLLEKLADEAQGSFRLAKVDVDSSPNLALRYGVRSIPNVKAFRDGQVVAEFVGVQPEPRLREFLRSLAPSQTDLVLEKALSQLDSENWKAAESSFRQFLAKTPDYPVALLGLLKSILMQGYLDEAARLLHSFPPSKEYAAAETLRPLAEALKWSGTAALSEDPLEAAYLNALRLVQRGNYAAALDGLLDILRQDKRYRDDEVRRVVLALLEALGENNPLTPAYRRELAMILF